MRKVNLAGAGGMLGQAFCSSNSDSDLRGTHINTNKAWLYNPYVCNLDEYRRDVRTFRPDAIFQLGAQTDLGDSWFDHPNRLAADLNCPTLGSLTTGFSR